MHRLNHHCLFLGTSQEHGPQNYQGVGVHFKSTLSGFTPHLEEKSACLATLMQQFQLQPSSSIESPSRKGSI
eukprot:scaffold56145_cov18-Tisochrysis_lutea.AAC.2